MMIYKNTLISLVTEEVIGIDSEGFEKIKSEVSTPIPAHIKSLTRADVEMAKQLGYNSTAIYVIKQVAYNGEPYLIDRATLQRYKIDRTYYAERSNDIELTVSRREHGIQADRVQ